MARHHLPLQGGGTETDVLAYIILLSFFITLLDILCDFLTISKDVNDGVDYPAAKVSLIFEFCIV
jgi:hypothetical protein